MPEFTEVKDVTGPEFREALEIYLEAFPPNERHPVEVITERVARQQSRLQVGRNRGEIASMALLWPLKGTSFILLDYLATKNSHRGQGLASAFLKNMLPQLRERNEFLVLEVEDPDSGDNRQEREGRVNFYRRLGVKELKQVKYILPALDGGQPTDMILMMFPAYGDGRLEAGLVKELVAQIYRELYGLDQEHKLVQEVLARISAPVELV